MMADRALPGAVFLSRDLTTIPTIEANPDISGIGVRVSFYAQTVFCGNLILITSLIGVD
jgi:hypothetical protein